ncbi:MAG: putative signal transducing protein [Dehalococcoidia bacterium]
MKWKVAATAPNQLVAEMWCEMLKDDGITATIKPGDSVSFLGVSFSPCRIMVSENELQAAKDLLATHTEQEEPGVSDQGSGPGD